MKLCVYLAAIGEPYGTKKLILLENNLNKIYENVHENFDIIINCFDKNLSFEKINDLHFIDNIYIYRKNGVLAELWYNNKFNYLIKNYDYLILILDDVLIEKLDIDHMIRSLSKFNLKFVSPVIKNSTWNCMEKHLKCNNVVSINYILELYFFLMKADDFKLFLSLHEKDNIWTWGIDHLFDYYNINVGVSYKNECKHLIKGKNNKKAENDMNLYIKKKNLNNISEIRKNFDSNFSIKYIKNFEYFK